MPTKYRQRPDIDMLTGIITHVHETHITTIYSVKSKAPSEYYFRDVFHKLFSKKEQSMCYIVLLKSLNLPECNFALYLSSRFPVNTNSYFGIFPYKCHASAEPNKSGSFDFVLTQSLGRHFI